MTGIRGCVWTVLCHGVTLRSDLLIISVASASESNYVSDIRFNCSLTEGVRTPLGITCVPVWLVLLSPCESFCLSACFCVLIGEYSDCDANIYRTCCKGTVLSVFEVFCTCTLTGYIIRYILLATVWTIFLSLELP